MPSSATAQGWVTILAWPPGTAPSARRHWGGQVSPGWAQDTPVPNVTGPEEAGSVAGSQPLLGCKSPGPSILQTPAPQRH